MERKLYRFVLVLKVYLFRSGSLYVAALGLYLNWKASCSGWMGNVLQANSKSHLEELLSGGHQPVLAGEARVHNETQQALLCYCWYNLGQLSVASRNPHLCAPAFFHTAALWDDLSMPAQRINALKASALCSSSFPRWQCGFWPFDTLGTRFPAAAPFSTTPATLWQSCWAINCFDGPERWCFYSAAPDEVQLFYFSR